MDREHGAQRKLGGKFLQRRFSGVCSPVGGGERRLARKAGAGLNGNPSWRGGRDRSRWFRGKGGFFVLPPLTKTGGELEGQKKVEDDLKPRDRK